VLNTYQTVLLILASNLVPAVLGGTITFLWLKYIKGWRKPNA